jgi:DNA-directed RNA polymerase subunit alpha
LLLNLKQVRFKFVDENEEEARLRLEVRGEGIVTAGDLFCPPTVEVMNPEHYLLTTDSPEADLEMEMTVSKGRGYSPAEERGKLPVSEIPTDAIYSPVRKVSYKIERARIGQVSNFDRLVIEIWTDGTIRPEEALNHSAGILIAHLRDLAGVSEESLTIGTAEPVAPKISSEILETPIEQLDLSVRVFNSLKRTGITTVGEVLELLNKGEDAVLSIRNFGEKSLDELREKLREKGFLRGPEAESAEPAPDDETKTE